MPLLRRFAQNRAARLYPAVFERSNPASHRLTDFLNLRIALAWPSQTGIKFENPSPRASSDMVLVVLVLKFDVVVEVHELFRGVSGMG